ncbi:MAG: VOC family protein [Terriglobia bacterium]|jgi:predicted 3-demethylubiquinone-9 3-methyltransferase (glyoxalase superfamily)|nr:VOC family protein [Terriglobia bacterium]
MPKITPFLWFDNQAEEAAKFYTSIFENSKINKVTRYEDAGPSRNAKVQVVEFELDGKPFIALNGGPQQFHFNESISFSVECRGQKEVDEYWSRLSAGGEEGPCGWLKDKYGLSWQITPVELIQLLSDPDRAKANRAMGAMLKMKKIDLAELKRAAEGQ